MASSMIHIAVANEINKKMKRDASKLLIGTIAPDISKLIGEKKLKSHFSTIENDNIPNIELFLNKYKNNLDDDFVMGYFIHLYTDYLWFKYFIDDIDWSSVIAKIDGTKVQCDREEFTKYIYNDYTNINISLIDKYNLDLKIFYNDIPKLNTIIEEIPMDKLGVIINKAAEIIANTKVNKAFLFDIYNVEQFINTSVDLILSKIKEIEL